MAWWHGTREWHDIRPVKPKELTGWREHWDDLWDEEKSVFGWIGERRVKIVGAWEFSHGAHPLGWNRFLPNLGEKIGRMSRFDEKLSICAFPLNLHCFLLSFSFFFFEKKKLSSSNFLSLYAIKFFLSNLNLYHLHFLYSHFFSLPNKRVFYSSTFHPQPNTTRENENLFYPSLFLPLPHFLFPHFFTFPTKLSLKAITPTFVNSKK